jgi:hypothetical protein
MSEPGLLSQSEAMQKEGLWERAPAWRGLTVIASLLTLAALATPLLSPQPIDTKFSPRPVPSHIVAAPVTAQPANPARAQTASSAPQIVPQALPQPVAPVEQHRIAPNLPVGTIIVPSGVLTKVNRHARGSQGHEWPVTITVISPPTRGKVTTQFAIGPNRTSNGTRIGNGTVVYYQSAPGYIGMDTFTYKRTSEDETDPLNANTYTMTIDVN